MEHLIKRYIPEKVFDYIQKDGFKNKEHLYVICDMIYRIGIYRKTDQIGGFVDIPCHYFQDIITKKSSYKAAMAYLSDSGILLCDQVASKEKGKAFGYKFTDPFQSKLVAVNISKGSLGSRIISNINSKNNFVNSKYSKYKSNFLQNFKIDYESAKAFIDQWYDEQLEQLQPHPSTSPYVGTFLKDWRRITHQYNSYFISLSAIQDGDLFFRKNKTNGRIDTNLTSLKAELKQFIIQDLWQIDIVNSQPFFLLLDILTHTPSSTSPYVGTFLKEVEKYESWVSQGLFYEKFEYQYLIHHQKSVTRREIKNMLFCIFYSQNNSYLPLKKVFASIFPNIMEYIHQRKSRKHNELAIQMQRLESDMCIETICEQLDINNILYYTIHDAWLVNQEDVQRTIEIIEEYFDKIYQKHPKLDIQNVKEKEKKKKTITI